LDNQQYIAGLLNNDHAILREIYENYADRIKHHIIKNGGTANDAKDVFQDALMIIYKKAQSEDFELTSQFYTYLFGICHFVFKRKRKKMTESV
jgi:DNA-directed RNA polymerase specialized sigma24 family protein